MQSPSAGHGEHPRDEPASQRQPPTPFTTHIDPVCGMSVFPAMAAGTVDHAGTTYYFCSQGCRARFQADPQKFLRAAKAAIDPVCGMTVDPSHAAGSWDHDGKTYHFCSRGCLVKFQADPLVISIQERNRVWTPCRPITPRA